MEKRILLVDDEEGIRKVLGIALADIGYQVLTAASGDAALALFRRERPPVVLTDIKMPGIDGIELLRQIKGESPDTEVIMITGHGDIDLAIKSLKYEATDFVTKPINDDALEIALKRANERIALRAQLQRYTENLEQLVAEKTRKLVEAERLAAVGQTVAGLSHAIKNIVGGLKGGIFVVEKGLELDNKKYLLDGWEMVKGNVDKIKNLSLDLLNYAKTAEVNLQIGDPNSPVREVYELMRYKAREAGVELVLDLDAKLTVFAFDPEGIHRCLLNLVANALDACKAWDGCKAAKTIHLRTIAASGGAMAYQVGDNCGGMTDEVRRQLFQNFFTTKGSRGTGIGLMMTKKIVDAHGGDIRIDTQPGQGSVFTIQLPKTDKTH